MSEYDKNKFFRRTKFYPTSRDTSHTSHFGSRPFNKTLGFSKHDRDYKDADRSSTSESKDRVIAQPTILLKTRDPQVERSVSPKRPTKENDLPQAAPSVVVQESVPVVTPSMSHCLKLIDDNTILFESVHEYLEDSSDFLVVGILGSQGTGKSTIMNLIAQNLITDEVKAEIFNYTGTESAPHVTESIKILSDNVNIKINQDECEIKRNTDIVFKPQTLDHVEVGNYGTSGVDFFITSNRVFLLDCQPIMCAAVLDEIVQSDFKRNLAGEFLPIENCAEIQSLQIATFVLSVCHVVLIVEDWFLDSNIVRFLQTAEMLKPGIPMAEEDFMEYFPHVMIVHNRATLQDFTPTQFGIMQQTYREVFAKSKLRFESGMGLGTGGGVVHGLADIRKGDPINLFLLPEYENGAEESSTESIYKGHPGFDELIHDLRAQVHSVTRVPLLSAQLTEKNWLQFSSKVWETIKKSSFFLEYSKLMP